VLENFHARGIGDGACGDLEPEFIQFLTVSSALFQFHPFAGREFLWYSFQLLFLAPTAANCAISRRMTTFWSNCQLMLGQTLASSEVLRQPASSKMMRPGRTTATQWSTGALGLYPCGFGGTLVTAYRGRRGSRPCLALHKTYGARAGGFDLTLGHPQPGSTAWRAYSPK